jgi:propanol-preferring alcohol dehydrogenase
MQMWHAQSLPHEGEAEEMSTRQQKARELGADLVLSPHDPDIRTKIMAYTDMCGVDACLETSGNVIAQRLCIDMVRRRGKVSLVGECGNDLAIQASNDFIRKGISLLGQWHYNLNGAHKLMQVIRDSPVAENLITHTFPMNEIQKAFEVCASQECGKVMILPWEGKTQ